MDWSFVIRHLISGSIPVLSALALYFLILRSMGKKQTAAHIILSFVFCFYLVGILSLTGICFRGSFSPGIIWMPFAYMISGMTDRILNIFLFIPMGFFLPLLYAEFDGTGRTVTAGFLVSLSIETAQMFGTGTTDVNDLITNTAGAWIGYLIYKMMYQSILKSWTGETRAQGISGFLELPLLWAGSMGIMLTIQTAVFHALFAHI